MCAHEFNIFDVLVKINSGISNKDFKGWHITEVLTCFLPSTPVMGLNGELQYWATRHSPEPRSSPSSDKHCKSRMDSDFLGLGCFPDVIPAGRDWYTGKLGWYKGRLVSDGGRLRAAENMISEKEKKNNNNWKCNWSCCTNMIKISTVHEPLLVFWNFNMGNCDN